MPTLINSCELSPGQGVIRQEPRLVTFHLTINAVILCFINVRGRTVIQLNYDPLLQRASYAPADTDIGEGDFLEVYVVASPQACQPHSFHHSHYPYGVLKQITRSAQTRPWGSKSEHGTPWGL